MKRVLKEVDGSGWLGALVFGGHCIFTFGHDMLSGWWKVLTVHSAYEDVDPLCNADLASDTVRAVFDVTRQLEYEVVDWEIVRSGS